MKTTKKKKEAKNKVRLDEHISIKMPVHPSQSILSNLESGILTNTLERLNSKCTT